MSAPCPSWGGETLLREESARPGEGWSAAESPYLGLCCVVAALLDAGFSALAEVPVGDHGYRRIGVLIPEAERGAMDEVSYWSLCCRLLDSGERYFWDDSVICLRLGCSDWGWDSPSDFGTLVVARRSGAGLTEADGQAVERIVRSAGTVTSKRSRRRSLACR